MKIKKVYLFTGFLLLWFVSNLLCKDYINNFGIDFESGIEEKSDIIIETIDDYYTFYKSNIFTQILSNQNNVEFKMNFENGYKNYNNDLLDNDFHIISFGYFKPLNEFFLLNINFKGGMVISEKFNQNTYSIKKIEPKLTFKINNIELYSSIIYQNKTYETKNSIQDIALNFGLQKTLSENSNIIFNCGVKKIEQEIDKIKNTKDNQYVKIGYLWQR